MVKLENHLLECLNRFSKIKLQWSQLRVQWGLRTSSKGLMARLGDGEFPSLRPGDPSRAGNDNDIVRLAGLSELLLLLLPLLFDII